MRENDGRKLDHHTLEQMRLRAVNAVESGRFAAGSATAPPGFGSSCALGRSICGFVRRGHGGSGHRGLEGDLNVEGTTATNTDDFRNGSTDSRMSIRISADAPADRL